jgi:hypothetical protein
VQCSPRECQAANEPLDEGGSGGDTAIVAFMRRDPADDVEMQDTKMRRLVDLETDGQCVGSGGQSVPRFSTTFTHPLLHLVCFRADLLMSGTFTCHLCDHLYSQLVLQATLLLFWK